MGQLISTRSSKTLNMWVQIICLVWCVVRCSCLLPPCRQILSNCTRSLRDAHVGRTEPEIVALREAALHVGHEPWLRLLHPTLDMPGGMLMMTLAGHSREVTSLAVDTDYRQLISASKDGTVRVWDTSDGQLLNILDTFYYNGLGILRLHQAVTGELCWEGVPTA